MMFDFDNYPFFDNHTHRINISNRRIRPIDFAMAFVHGRAPVHELDEAAQKEREYNIMNMGVVKTMISLMAQKYGCEATPETVIAERNKRTEKDGFAYAQELYREAGVIGEVVDDGAVFGDPVLQCFPTKIYRLFQMDPCVRTLLKECEDYQVFMTTFDAVLRQRLEEGFIGVKSHLLELRSQPIYPISDEEAAARYQEAVNGDRKAFEDVYLAAFQQVLIMTQELGFSVHVHTGCTGNPNDLQTNTDPYVMAPLMRDDRFADARIVLLHGNPPDFGHAAWLTHCYPNVWVDIGWSLPWLSLNIEQILETVIGIAPHSKVMFGSGQHDHAEVVWAASKIIKTALANVLERKVNAGLLSKEQAEETARQLLYKNALRLYGLEEPDRG